MLRQKFILVMNFCSENYKFWLFQTKQVPKKPIRLQKIIRNLLASKKFRNKKNAIMMQGYAFRPLFLHSCETLPWTFIFWREAPNPISAREVNHFAQFMHIYLPFLWIFPFWFTTRILWSAELWGEKCKQLFWISWNVLCFFDFSTVKFLKDILALH
jgi:hypothetical protein